jgi:hypothetical protein
MSASFFGGEVKYTKRYQLGQLLGGITRHFLLMSATPHNGKEEDFQLFMALLDADRFEGRFRDGVHQVDTSDLMRRLIKEQLLKFDGTKLFPERIAGTVTYRLSDLEAQLYADVTQYVREEMNRADSLQQEGEGRRGAVVGFAMTSLQRRLSSSPEAILRSIQRRRERLEKRLREEQVVKRGLDTRIELDHDLAKITTGDLEELLDDDAPATEAEVVEERVVDQASTARTIRELELEIGSLRQLEALAIQVRRSGTDRKWDELSKLLQDDKEMFDASGHRHKLIIFTEHRDTLNYLKERIEALLGDPEAVVVIHGGMGREERRKVQELFTQDKSVQILLATDAAGEGINLQRAHLMVNYDLPWNPNRLEQRFGRIHRIGQTEVCHLWNLVAEETREGDVFKRLFEKLEVERNALGGQVFDVLGQVFGERPLRDLLIQAIRYGDSEEVRAQLFAVVDNALDHAHFQTLLDRHALVRDALDASKVYEIREEMERANARRLQPHFIQSFFLEAFGRLGGTVKPREEGRYEITHVPAAIRQRDRQIGIGEPVLTRYERVCFEKEHISVPGKPMAAFLAPGHPLLDATIDLILERYRELLKRGALLVAPDDTGTDLRVLVIVEHAVRDGRRNPDGSQREISKQLQFVTIDAHGSVRDAGPAPYLHCRPLQEEEYGRLAAALGHEVTSDVDSLPWPAWLSQGQFEARTVEYANGELAPRHRNEVRERKRAWVAIARGAVKDRLTKEIKYWDHRARQLREQESAGKKPRGGFNSTQAQQRADELERRLRDRLAELDQEEQIAAMPAVVVGGTLVIPAGLLDAGAGASFQPDQEVRDRIDRLAIAAVLEAERALGFEPRELDHNHPGYDIESRDRDGRLRFIEVKGKGAEQETVMVSKNQILMTVNVLNRLAQAIVP